MVCLLSLRASWSSNLHLAKTVCLAFLITLASNLSAQTKPEPPGPDFSKIFRKTDAMVPMRDGLRLHTEIYVPKKMSQPLPFIFERTGSASSSKKSHRNGNNFHKGKGMCLRGHGACE